MADDAVYFRRVRNPPLPPRSAVVSVPPAPSASASASAFPATSSLAAAFPAQHAFMHNAAVHVQVHDQSQAQPLQQRQLQQQQQQQETRMALPPVQRKSRTFGPSDEDDDEALVARRFYTTAYGSMKSVPATAQSAYAYRNKNARYAGIEAAEARAEDLRAVALGAPTEGRTARYAHAAERERTAAARRSALMQTESDEERDAREQIRRQVGKGVHPEDVEREERAASDAAAAAAKRLAWNLALLDSDDTRGTLVSRSHEASENENANANENQRAGLFGDDDPRYEDEREDPAVLASANAPWALKPAAYSAAPAPMTRGADAKDRSAQELFLHPASFWL